MIARNSNRVYTTQVAHSKLVVVSFWIVQALCFCSDKMKPEQSSSGGDKKPFICSLRPKRCKNSQKCIPYIIIKRQWFFKIQFLDMLCFLFVYYFST